MPSFEHNNFYLLGLSHIFEPTSQYSLDYTFSSIDNEISSYERWDEEIDAPIPSKAIDCTPKNWYTQYWFNCVLNNLSADLTNTNYEKSVTTHSKTTKQSILGTSWIYTKILRNQMSTCSDWNIYGPPWRYTAIPKPINRRTTSQTPLLGSSWWLRSISRLSGT